MRGRSIDYHEINIVVCIHTPNLKTRHCQVKTTEHSFYSSFHLIYMHPTLIVGHIPIHYYWTYLEIRTKWICTGEQHLCKWEDIQGQPYRRLCCLYLQRWVLMFASENHCKKQKNIWCMSWLLAPQLPMASIAVSWMHFSAEPSHPSLVQDPIGVQSPNWPAACHGRIRGRTKEDRDFTGQTCSTWQPTWY